MPTFTIIIPHKNIPDLLVRCLNSIPDIEDIQLIVVDDNSNPEIVDFGHFPGIDRKFTQVIFDKDAKGAGHARNVALPLVKGKWLMFADADDFFVTGFYDKICKYQQAQDDLIIFAPDAIMSKNVEEKSNRVSYITRRFDRYRRGMISSREAALGVFIPWSKMIKSSLVKNNNIIFDETRFNNDVMFSTKVGCFAQNILLSDDVVYIATERDDNLTSNRLKDGHDILFWLGIIIKANHFMISHGYHPQPLINIYVFALRNGWLTFARVIYRAARNGMLFIGASDIFRPKDRRKWI